MLNDIAANSSDKEHRISTENNLTPGGYYLHTRPEIIELVPITARKLLDVGCGAGGLCVGLKKRQEITVEGVELVEQAAIHARVHMDKVLNCTIDEALPNLLDDYYDCIVAADVLEHVIDPWATLIALKEKLADDGKIVVSLPNVQNWEVVSNLLEGKWDYRSEGILDRTHLHFFTRKSVEELFWNAGLRIVHMGTTIRGPSLPNNLADSLSKSALAAGPMVRDAETFQFLVVAEKPNNISSPRVAIIILNWNGKEDTLECLASVGQMEYPNYEIIVVDNGSSDDSVDAISNQYPEIKIIQTGANLGYAGGNNVGIRWALEHNADFVMVLNNDTIVAKDMLSHLVKVSFLDDRIGLLGPTNYYHSEPNVIWATGAILEKLPTAGYKILGDGDSDRSWKVATQVDALLGSCMLIKNKVFNKINLFDERFFLCWEEFDFSERANNAGFKCFFVPEAKIWHKVGSALGPVESPLRSYFNIRNRLLWAKRHLPQQFMSQLRKENIYTLRRILFPPFYFQKSNTSYLKSLFWSLSSWLKTIKRNVSDPMNQATLMALRDYYLGRFGDCPPKVRLLNKIN